MFIGNVGEEELGNLSRRQGAVRNVNADQGPHNALLTSTEWPPREERPQFVSSPHVERMAG
jgi:hypothetical protein